MTCFGHFERFKKILNREQENDNRDNCTDIHIVPGVLKTYQSESWDCGLACASSILKTLGMVSLEKWSGIQTPKRSLWTIEIVHLLHQFGVQQLIYTTTCLGVNHDYLEKLKFYADEENEDIGVINALFKKAQEDKICILRQSITAEELKNAASSGDYLILALVDCNTLGKTHSRNASYVGHYILIYGYNSRLDLFYAKDPAKDEDVSEIPSDIMDNARKVYGTDEDLVFVSINGYM